MKSYFILGFGDGAEVGFIQILNSDFFGFAYEELIEFGPVPMSVGDPVMRTGGDKQLILPVRIILIRLAQRVVIKSKTSLQPASHMGISSLPRPPLS